MSRFWLFILFVVVPFLLVTSILILLLLPLVMADTPHQVTLVLAFDGFRHDYMDKTETPFFSHIKQEGVRVPFMSPQFPASTFTNFASMSTGLYPDNHGAMDNFVYDPEVGKVLSGFDDDPGYWTQNPGAIPIWLLNELAGKGRISGTMLWPGSAVGYGPDLSLFPTYYVPDRDYNEKYPWEFRVSTVLSWITSPEKPANLVFLYYSEPDNSGHRLGPNSPDLLPTIQDVDEKLGYLLEELKNHGIQDKVNIIIVGDHGMEEKSTERIIPLSAAGVDPSLYTRIGGSPNPQLRVTDPENVDLIYEKFKEFSLSRNFSVYKKAELNGTLPGWGQNSRVMDILLLADPGYVFEDGFRKWSSADNRIVTGGTHGYDPDVPSMRTIFLAKGPSFKKEFDLPHGISNLDLMPLLCRITQIPEPEHDGSFQRIKDILIREQ